MLDDAKQLIGVDANDPRNLMIENVKNAKADKLKSNCSSCKNFISTLVYDKGTASLYSGDNRGYLLQYKVDTTNKTFKKVRDYGKLGIGCIRSSHRFLNFVFFGGNKGKIRVLDLSTGKLLLGCLRTSIRLINSLQVCVKGPKHINLAVSGEEPTHFLHKIDLFDLTDFLVNDLDIIQNSGPEDVKDHEEIIIEEPSTIKTQTDNIKNLKKERDSFKTKLSEVSLKYNNFKERQDMLHNQNTEFTKAYKKLKTGSDIKKHNMSKRTTIDTKESLIGKRSFEKIEPLVIPREPRKDIDKKEHLNKVFQKTNDTTSQEKADQQEEAQNIRMNLKAAESQILRLEEIIAQR